jgi:exopolysaccharide biosynthesis protein
MRIKDLDNYSFITGVIAFVVVGLLVLVVASNKYITTECKKTTETRTTTSYIQSGNVFLPITMTQHRYICPDGKDAWL